MYLTFGIFELLEFSFFPEYLFGNSFWGSLFRIHLLNIMEINIEELFESGLLGPEPKTGKWADGMPRKCEEGGCGNWFWTAKKRRIHVQKEHGGPELGTAAGGQEFSFWAALDRNPQCREGFTAQQVAQGKHFFISP